jgi:hypothetical protein
MNRSVIRVVGLGVVVGGLALLAACNGGDGSGGNTTGQCYCPAGVGTATIELCGAIVSSSVDPDGACNLQQTSGSLELTSDVAGTCEVEVTFASGATASTEITFTSTSTACGSDPHGCQGVVATTATVMLGACGDAGASGD